MNVRITTTFFHRFLPVAIAACSFANQAHGGNCKTDLVDPSGDAQAASGNPVDFTSASAVFTDPEQEILPEFILDLLFAHDVAAPSNPPPLAGAAYPIYGIVFVDKDQNPSTAPIGLPPYASIPNFGADAIILLSSEMFHPGFVAVGDPSAPGGTFMATVSYSANRVSVVFPTLFWPGVTDVNYHVVVGNQVEPTDWGSAFGTSCTDGAALCLADISGNGSVEVSDLLLVINGWGQCPAGSLPGGCPADIAPAGPPAGDGVVDVLDLLAVINQWGPCP